MEIEPLIVSEYARNYEDGIEMPPVDVFFDGVSYWLADGFHRWHGSRRAGRKTIDCIVHTGTVDDARWFSYGANKAHGLRRTNEDKRKAVYAALRHPNAAKKSDPQIAGHVGVSSNTVRKYREEMESTSQIAKSTARTGRDGRTINTSNIGKRPAPTPPAPSSPPDPPAPQVAQPTERKAEQPVTVTSPRPAVQYPAPVVIAPAPIPAPPPSVTPPLEAKPWPIMGAEKADEVEEELEPEEVEEDEIDEDSAMAAETPRASIDYGRVTVLRRNIDIINEAYDEVLQLFFEGSITREEYDAYLDAVSHVTVGTDN